MSINARVVALDNTGHGVVTIQPGFYCGSKGATNVTAEDGTSLGTAFLTRGSSIATEGAIDVTGTPSTEATLYFDFSG
jgi:hypothetical protein